MAWYFWRRFWTDPYNIGKKTGCYKKASSRMQRVLYHDAWMHGSCWLFMAKNREPFLFHCGDCRILSVACHSLLACGEEGISAKRAVHKRVGVLPVIPAYERAENMQKRV